MNENDNDTPQIFLTTRASPFSTLGALAMKPLQPAEPVEPAEPAVPCANKPFPTTSFLAIQIYQTCLSNLLLTSILFFFSLLSIYSIHTNLFLFTYLLVIIFKFFVIYREYLYLSRKQNNNYY